MTLASVTKPKHVTQHHALHVYWQSTKAGSQHTAGCRVSIRFLGPRAAVESRPGDRRLRPARRRALPSGRRG